MTRIRRDPPETKHRRRTGTPPQPGALAVKRVDLGRTKLPFPKVVDIAGLKLNPSPVLATFFAFVSERHQVFCRRLAGEPQSEWTQDPILQQYPFTNVFRVFDRVTQYILLEVVRKGDQALHEQCFRLMLFRSFNKVETWEYLLEKIGDLTWRDFDLVAYEKALLTRQQQGIPLYNPAYIIPSPKLGASAAASNHLRLIQLMMEEDLPSQLQELEHLKDAHGRIMLFPGMGEFMALQLLLDLNMTSHFNYSEDEWVALGPGSLECLRKMFGPDVRGHELDALRWLHQTQHEHFARLGTPPDRVPQLVRGRAAGLSMVDMEHALCECEKYSRAAHPTIQGRRQRVGKRQFAPRPAPITAEVPAHWLDARSRRRTVYAEPPPVELDGLVVYEVSHIVAERKNSQAGDPAYLIRWVGWGPDDDTWERESTLADGAPDVLAEWTSAKARIRARVQEFQEMGARYRPSLGTQARKGTETV
ncbi:hypothetical protein DICSQDRAFT_133894 [Dichomitus squalens LYAD-421 SS1]|uniref:uncharacterized protein n=1 Tax=Dichomitus squalens (strain LYAD-421) TaxID=732165 RepID=UPI00044153E0|nr:uncharacterized protein DICSQDRAFT_133894 [Dichomitus squalens LYAD-421 SS1]EJF64224.1 hypothetical protein DICSQDRAFT_133894 [Dichomitus squalens LYAD-421 SS1]